MIDHASEMAAFVRVVDSKGFSAAAPVLGLTPSAVSKLVTRLETRLGARLLQRTTRALHLTQEGEVFYAAAQRIVGEIETLESQMTGHSGTPHGLLRVTTFRMSMLCGSLSRIAVGAMPFLMPMMFQLGFGLSAVQSGLITFVSSIGSLAMRACAPAILSCVPR